MNLTEIAMLRNKIKNLLNYSLNKRPIYLNDEEIYYLIADLEKSLYFEKWKENNNNEIIIENLKEGKNEKD